MTAARHTLTILERAGSTRRRWVPVCSCGRWWGIRAKTRSKARAQHHAHVSTPEVAAERRRRRTPVQPRPVTPEHRLPAELRRGAA